MNPLRPFATLLGTLADALKTTPGLPFDDRQCICNDYWDDHTESPECQWCTCGCSYFEAATDFCGDCGRPMAMCNIHVNCRKEAA